jgi:acetyl-CoA acetyltransferase family protein
MNEPVIVGAIRTPMGKRGGALSAIRPDELYATALTELVRQVGIDPAAVEDVITGCVTETGEQGGNLGRQAALISRLPKEVPAVTLNRMCGSSQQAIHFAAQAVAAGDMRYVIAGGVESMSRVAMFSDIGGTMDTLGDKLKSKYEIIHQGESAERIAERYSISREDLDDFSYRSHVRAAHATESGYFRSQLIPVEGTTKEGTSVPLSQDEGIRFNLDRSKMAKLPPIFRPAGVITAANSSQISDGASAVLIAEASRAKADGITPLARFRSRVAVGGDPTLQLLEVIPATKLALERAKVKLQDIDVFEVNEAFASVVLAWTREFKIDPDRLNPNGGAIAHGHPLGATGAALMTKLVFELHRKGGRLGLQVMCIGHGMATATVIERL